MAVGVLVAAKGIGGVVVETANQLQGLEFDVVVAWHSRAGLPSRTVSTSTRAGSASC
jgi:hypothetical protein